MRDYLKLLNDLKDGVLDELPITAEAFQDFQPVFMDFPERKQLIGEAQRGGTITYRYENNKKIR